MKDWIEKYIGQPVVVDCGRYTTYCGTLVAYKKHECVLGGAREVAYEQDYDRPETLFMPIRLSAGNIDINQGVDCEFSDIIDVILVMNVIRIIPCSKDALENIEKIIRDKEDMRKYVKGGSWENIQ